MIEQTFTLDGLVVQLETEHFNAAGSLGSLAYDLALQSEALPEASYNIYGSAVVIGNAYQQTYYSLKWSLLVPTVLAYQLDALVTYQQRQRAQQLEFAIQLVDLRGNIAEATPRSRATASLAQVISLGGGTIEAYSPIWQIAFTAYTNNYYMEGFRRIEMTAQELELVDVSQDLA